MPERARPVFFDTVTLSNFALVDRLDVLLTRYGRRAQVTQAVLDELAHGVVIEFARLAAVESAVNSGKLTAACSLSPSARLTFRECLRTLGPGEASCIAAAHDCNGIVATDDRTARACCTERNIPLTGTIGILRACVRDGTVSVVEADQILDAMIRAGYRSPVQRISDLE